MPAVAAAALADDLVDRLRPLGTPERAEGQRRYLKSTLDHLGVTVPGIRSTVGQFVAAHPQLAASDHVALAGPLWSRRIFELRLAAVLLLERGRDELDADVLDTVEGLLRDAHTWALVDPLAINVTGQIARRDPRVWHRVDAWGTDGDLWVRRASLLAHLPTLRDDLAAFARFSGHADRMLTEHEFFIRKAIGWVLREVGKRDPAMVVAWLEPRTVRVSGVTLREAVKYVPAADRDRLLTAYRQRRSS